MKYLKSGGGFANYDLAANPASRYLRKRDRLQSSALWGLKTTREALAPGALRRLRATIDSKERLAVARDLEFGLAFPQGTLTEALDATAPGWRHWLRCAP